MNKKIAVFGHRKIAEKNKNWLENNLYIVFENFITRGDNIYLFGSNSEFNDLCYTIITNFKNKYTNIKRIGYLCAREIVFTLEESCKYVKYIEKVKLKGKNIKIYEDIKQFDFDDRNLYIERNKRMIDDADVCIFYYNEIYCVTNSKGIKTSS